MAARDDHRCSAREPGLADVALGAAPDVELGAHLRECRACTDALARHRAVWGAVAALPRAATRETLKGELMAAAAGSRGTSRPSTSAEKRELFAPASMPELPPNPMVRSHVLAVAAGRGAPASLPRFRAVPAAVTAPTPLAPVAAPPPEPPRRRWLLPLVLAGVPAAVLAISAALLYPGEVPATIEPGTPPEPAPPQPEVAEARPGPPVREVPLRVTPRPVTSSKKVLVLSGTTEAEQALTREYFRATVQESVKVPESATEADLVAAARKADAIVAIGPEAYEFALTLPGQLPLVYALVPPQRQRAREAPSRPIDVAADAGGELDGAALAAAALEASEAPRPASPPLSESRVALLEKAQTSGALAEKPGPPPAEPSGAFLVEEIRAGRGPVSPVELALAGSLLRVEATRILVPGAPGAPQYILRSVLDAMPGQKLRLDVMVMSNVGPKAPTLLGTYNVKAGGARPAMLLKAMVPRVVADIAGGLNLGLAEPGGGPHFPWNRIQVLSGPAGAMAWGVTRRGEEITVQVAHPKWSATHLADRDGTPRETRKVVGKRTSRLVWTAEGVEYLWDLASGEPPLKIREKGLWDGDSLDARLAGIDWEKQRRVEFRIVDTDKPAGNVIPMSAELVGAATCPEGPCYEVRLRYTGLGAMFVAPWIYRYGTGGDARYLYYEHEQQRFTATGQ